MAGALPLVSVICLAQCASVRPGVRGQGDTTPRAQLPLPGEGHPSLSPGLWDQGEGVGRGGWRVSGVTGHLTFHYV